MFSYVIGDVTLVVCAAVVARYTMVYAGVADIADWSRWMSVAGAITSIIVATFYYADLYALDQTLSRREMTLRFLNGFGIACFIIGMVSYSMARSWGAKHLSVRNFADWWSGFSLGGCSL